MFCKAWVLVVLLSLNSPAEDLREAVRAGKIEHIKAALKSGANVNEVYENGFTLIFFASDPQVVDFLIAQGVKLDVRNSIDTQSPIEDAARQHQFYKKERKNWKLIVNKLRKAGAEYTIVTAIYMNDLAFIRAALQKDVSWVHKTEEYQITPLRRAAQIGHLEICKLLLAHKADPDDFEEEGGYPTMVYAIDHPAIVKLLIKHGANLKRRITWIGGKTGLHIVGDEATALHFAVNSGNLESVKVLIEAGLDPNATDNAGQTPLHIALLGERWKAVTRRESVSFLEIIKYLLKHDASLRMTNKAGQTPFELAKELELSKAILKTLE